MKADPAKVKFGKRDAVLNAMLEIVAEHGFHEAPMSLVSKLSGASPGAIYHHFASKEEIIQALYERTRNLKVAALLKNYSDEMDAKSAFLVACNNLYDFYRRHQREMRFLEQFESAGFRCRAGEEPADERLASFERRFTSRARGGVLKDWPQAVIEEMTIGLVARLASQPQRIPGPVLEEIAEEMWEAVRAKD